MVCASTVGLFTPRETRRVQCIGIGTTTSAASARNRSPHCSIKRWANVMPSDGSFVRLSWSTACRSGPSYGARRTVA